MHSSDQLFDLIHSLKKEEKRHFRLYVKKYSKSSNYLVLFDAIAVLKEYDESYLKKQLTGMYFVHRLSVAKEYLYNLILRSLRDIEPAAPSELVLTLIKDISILLDRRLYIQAKKKIRKAKELAAAYDLFGEHYIILELEGYLPDVDRNELFKSLGKHLREVNEVFKLGTFAESLRLLYEEKGKMRTKDDSIVLKKKNPNNC